VLAHGIAVRPPPAWDVRIYRRDAAPGEQTHAILHAGNFGLPRHRGDYGSGAVELMKSHNVFIALFEHEPRAAFTPLFSQSGFPSSRWDDFSPRGLQRTLPGQTGAQYFFNHRSRAFCLYVVLGSHNRRRLLVPEVNRMLSTIVVR
jgi:hypothetical protein